MIGVQNLRDAAALANRACHVLGMGDGFKEAARSVMANYSVTCRMIRLTAIRRVAPVTIGRARTGMDTAAASIIDRAAAAVPRPG